MTKVKNSKRNKTVVFNMPVKWIEHHPDNPRKDLGDLEELTDSIKENGVMQNLTVVPASEELEKYVCSEIDALYPISSADEWEASLDDYKAVNGPESLKFYCLIGNRRLEASKAAELKEIPVQIRVRIEKADQVGIMLCENMQRSDLTVVEQVRGFQMMLDLGDSADVIAEKTGFSKATVYHRLNLAKLEPEIFDNAMEKKQLSLTELACLEKLEDIEKRNEILKKAADSNMDLTWLVKQELDAIEKAEKRDKVLAALRKVFKVSEFPEDKHQYDSDIHYVERVDFTDTENFDAAMKETIEDIEEDYPEGSEFFYTENYYGGIVLYSQHDKEEDEEDTEEEERTNRIREAHDELDGMFDALREKVYSGVAYVIDKGSGNEKYVSVLWRFMLEHNMFIRNPLEELTDFVSDVYGEGFDIDMSETGSEEENERIYQADYAAAVRKQIEEFRPDQQMLICLMYWIRSNRVFDWNHEYKESAGRDWNDFLRILDDKYYFRIGNEELAELIDGTHELYEEGKDD